MASTATVAGITPPAIASRVAGRATTSRRATIAVRATTRGDARRGVVVAAPGAIITARMMRGENDDDRARSAGGSGRGGGARPTTSRATSRHRAAAAAGDVLAAASSGDDADAPKGETRRVPWDKEPSKPLAETLEAAGDKLAIALNERLNEWEPPKFVWRTLYTLLLLGLVIKRVVWQRKLNMAQTIQQIARVGPDTLGVAMLTSSFVGMVFTIQFCKEFSKVGLTRVIGGLLGLAFTRELTPVICAIVLAGRVGSAIAAELGTMQVSEQVDQLRTLGSDPVDYLVAPRVVACALSLPILSVVSFTIGMAASILLADLRYGISPNAIVDSAAKYLETSDIGVMCVKGLAFGGVIATISCGWGQTTTGGAKGVGESTTASVVISLVAIFVVDFFLSMIFFNK
jgi:ABC transport permease subunit